MICACPRWQHSLLDWIPSDMTPHLAQAVGAIISGFCREVFNELPLEFAAEVNELMSLKLEGTVG